VHIIDFEIDSINYHDISMVYYVNEKNVPFVEVGNFFRQLSLFIVERKNHRVNVNVAQAQAT
jgi:hypothetical protein